MVIRFGVMKMVGEFPYSGTAKPGCGSKLVIKTHRGTELGEMLTSTCPNSGCSKSVSRKEMLQYISNSGGRDYPFTTEGRVLRIAEQDDLTRQQELEQSKHGLRLTAKAAAERIGLKVKIVDAEPILGGETLTFYYLSEERIDLGDLLNELRRDFRQHVELRHVGARDEARISADYERCGQYCCCKNFLKVLKPISMKSAKTQKATLDPLKISGRCGRLMCCLRYEDQTYEDLKKNLPRKKSRVGTPEGDGTVIDSQILTQLVLVRLDSVASDGKTLEMAVPVEDLSEPISKTPPPPAPMDMGRPGGPPQRGPQGARPQPPRSSAPPRQAPGDRPQPAPAASDATTETPRVETPRVETPRPERPRQDRGPRPGSPPREGGGGQRGPRPEGDRRGEQPRRDDGRRDQPREGGGGRPPRSEGPGNDRRPRDGSGGNQGGGQQGERRRPDGQRPPRGGGTPRQSDGSAPGASGTPRQPGNGSQADQSPLNASPVGRADLPRQMPSNPPPPRRPNDQPAPAAGPEGSDEFDDGPDEGDGPDAAGGPTGPDGAPGEGPQGQGGRRRRRRRRRGGGGSGGGGGDRSRPPSPPQSGG
jgi:cell fate regulator YaaT (PSP1 superfamily)